MVENIKPKIRTIIILIIGAFISLMASYACALDWSNKLKNGEDWSGNLFYHPITGITSIIFFTLCAIFIIERITPGQIIKIKDYIDGKNHFNLITILIIIISLSLLIISSFMLLIVGASSVGFLTTSHVLMGIVTGICLTIIILKPLINKLLDNPSKWQNYILIIVIIVIVVFIAWVLIAAAMGRLSLGRM